MTKPNSALQAGGDETPVAQVLSWTNGSYSRNYQLRWLRDVPEGTQLFTRPTPAAAAEVPTELLPEHVDALAHVVGMVAMQRPGEGFVLRAKDAMRVLREIRAACPVAPAGVPIDELQLLRELVEATDAYQAALPTRNWDLHDPAAAKAEQDRIDAASARKRAAWANARAVLSAGAPAVPMQDSSSSHLADNESTAVTEQAAVGDRARFTVDAPLEKRKQISKVLTLAQDWRRATLPDSADPPGTQLALRELLRESVYELAGVPYENIDVRPAVLCDGRDGVTGSGASSEAREATSSSSGSDGPEISAAGMAQDAARYQWLCEHLIVPSPSLWSEGLGFIVPIKATRSGFIDKSELDAAIDAALRAVPHQPTGERE